MNIDLEEIILYLNANEPTGKYCKNIENLKNDLKRLEQIDNAEPSKSLECLSKLLSFIDNISLPLPEYVNLFDCITTIRQSLLKQQETKKYFTWDDIVKLEPKNSMCDCEYAYLDVKLNGMPVHLFVSKDRKTKRVWVSGSGNDKMGTTLFNVDSDMPKSIEFFNALHLEVIE